MPAEDPIFQHQLLFLPGETPGWAGRQGAGAHLGLSRKCLQMARRSLMA